MFEISDNNDIHASPLRVFVTVPGTPGGGLALMGFPGLLTGVDSQSYIDPSLLAESFDEMKSEGIVQFMSFAHAEDLPDNAHAMIRAEAKRVGIDFHWLPITDFNIPDGETKRRWREHVPEILDLLNHGSSLGICCLSGIGRTGMMAARILVERGMDPKQAIAWIRKSLPEAIENKQQEDWVGAKADPDI